MKPESHGSSSANRVENREEREYPQVEKAPKVETQKLHAAIIQYGALVVLFFAVLRIILHDASSLISDFLKLFKG